VKRKQFLAIVSIVLAASVLSAVLAYRRGLRRGQFAVSSEGNSGSACWELRDAAAHAGETGCVRGCVLRVYTSRAGNTFLDFCSDYRNCPFTSVIFSSDKDKFGKLETLAGRRVEIRGDISVYQGRPEIIIRDPEQLRAAP
jgi:hypothetical protein